MVDKSMPQQYFAIIEAFGVHYFLTISFKSKINTAFKPLQIKLTYRTHGWCIKVIQESDKLYFSIIVGRLKLEKPSATSFAEYFELRQRSSQNMVIIP